MAKKSEYSVEEIPFSGLELHAIDEFNLEPVGASLWLAMRRRDGSIVRVWISHPVERTTPLKVTVEVEDQ